MAGSDWEPMYPFVSLCLNWLDAFEDFFKAGHATNFGIPMPFSNVEVPDGSEVTLNGIRYKFWLASDDTNKQSWFPDAGNGMRLLLPQKRMYHFLAELYAFWVDEANSFWN